MISFFFFFVSRRKWIPSSETSSRELTAFETFTHRHTHTQRPTHVLYTIRIFFKNTTPFIAERFVIASRPNLRWTRIKQLHLLQLKNNIEFWHANVFRPLIYRLIIVNQTAGRAQENNKNKIIIIRAAVSIICRRDALFMDRRRAVPKFQAI